MMIMAMLVNNNSTSNLTKTLQSISNSFTNQGDITPPFETSSPASAPGVRDSHSLAITALFNTHFNPVTVQLLRRCLKRLVQLQQISRQRWIRSRPLWERVTEWAAHLPMAAVKSTTTVLQIGSPRRSSDE